MDNQPNDQEEHHKLAKLVGDKADRKLNARRKNRVEVWFGLGMMGLIGWSISVPTLLGIALGVWLDKQHQGPHSWTLALLTIGLGLGCFIAWHWVIKEGKSIHQEDQNDDK